MSHIGRHSALQGQTCAPSYMRNKTLLSLFRRVADQVGPSGTHRPCRLGVACPSTHAIVGMIRDNGIADGFDVLDQWNYREWLQRHGGSDEAVWSPLTASWYNAIASFVDGGVSKPDTSSAIPICGILFCSFGIMAHIPISSSEKSATASSDPFSRRCADAALDSVSFSIVCAAGNLAVPAGARSIRLR